MTKKGAFFLSIVFLFMTGFFLSCTEGSNYFKEIKKEDPKDGKKKEAKTDPNSSINDPADDPVDITGAFLYCAPSENNLDSSSTLEIYCGIRLKSTQKRYTPQQGIVWRLTDQQGKLVEKYAFEKTPGSANLNLLENKIQKIESSTEWHVVMSLTLAEMELYRIGTNIRTDLEPGQPQTTLGMDLKLVPIKNTGFNAINTDIYKPESFSISYGINKYYHLGDGTTNPLALTTYTSAHKTKRIRFQPLVDYTGSNNTYQVGISFGFVSKLDSSCDNMVEVFNAYGQAVSKKHPLTPSTFVFPESIYVIQGQFYDILITTTCNSANNNFIVGHIEIRSGALDFSDTLDPWNDDD